MSTGEQAPLELDILRVFEKEPGALQLYQALENKLLEAVPGTLRKVGKTEVAF